MNIKIYTAAFRLGLCLRFLYAGEKTVLFLLALSDGSSDRAIKRYSSGRMLIISEEKAVE